MIFNRRQLLKSAGATSIVGAVGVSNAKASDSRPAPTSDSLVIENVSGKQTSITVKIRNKNSNKNNIKLENRGMENNNNIKQSISSVGNTEVIVSTENKLSKYDWEIPEEGVPKYMTLRVKICPDKIRFYLMEE